MTDFLKYGITPVKVQPPDARTPEVFAHITKLLAPHFPGRQFVHFGSTSVAGLRGKGVIDLFILAQPEEYEQCLATLESLGFQYPTFAPQPLPAHRPWRIAAVQFGNSLHKINVHLTPPNSPDHKNALRFVEALQRNPELRAAYEKAKHNALAQGFTELTAYNQQKDRFVKKFFARKPEAPTPACKLAR
jgi:GrpB-like predicted nucleotidyltransferase (UPF0157 family)